MKERREARCDDRACVTVTDPEGKQQEWERRLQKSESQHLSTIIVIELGVGSLAKHMRGCLRGTGAHWCYSKGKKIKAFALGVVWPRASPVLNSLLLSPSSICL